MEELRAHVLALREICVGASKLQEIVRGLSMPPTEGKSHVFLIFTSTVADPCARLLTIGRVPWEFMERTADTDYCPILGIWINVCVPEDVLYPSCNGYIKTQYAYRHISAAGAEVLRADDCFAAYCLLVPETFAAARFPDEYSRIGTLSRTFRGGTIGM